MGEDSDDVILVFEEKKFIENINYAVWPGDINHEERERAKKRKRDNEGNSNNNNEEADTNDKDEDPIHNLNKRACLSNRYFSSENTIKLVSGDKSTTTSTRQTFTRNNAASGENDDFVRRRDYLMKKLLQSRTLPNLDEDQQTQLPPSKSSVEIPVEITSKKSSGEDVEKKPAPLMTNKSLPTTSSSSFNVNDEFIPLRSAETPTTSTSENRETPSTPLENVNGCNLRPYPRDSINRVKDHLKYLFSENSPFALYESNQAQRTFEIVKLKLGLNSKFANDPSMLRRIEREKAEAKRFLQDRFKLIEAKLRRSNPNATCIDLCTTEEEDDDDDDEAEETDEDERDEIMKYIAKEDTINLDDDDDSEDERTSSSEKSDDDEEDDESEKEDSKYYQYGKYSTKKNKGEEVPVIKKGKKVSSISSRVNLSKVKSKGKKQLGNTKGQDLDQLEVDYNALRRRKLNNLKRKKKRTLSKSEFELEKKLINTELRKMRKSMRKMKNKKQKTNQATNSSSSIVSLNSNSKNSKNSTDKYKKRTNKPKRNKSFFIDNSGFNPFRHGANIKKPKGRFFPRFNKYEVLQRNSKKNYNH